MLVVKLLKYLSPTKLNVLSFHQCVLLIRNGFHIFANSKLKGKVTKAKGNENREHVVCHGCKTSIITLVDCPYIRSYPYLAIACHIAKHQVKMMHWGESSYFTSSNEGVAIKKRIKSARVRMKDEIFLVKANVAWN